MKFIQKDGINLAYEEKGQGSRSMVLIHGLGCDYKALAAQADFFSKTHRVISVDLRGHGESDAPKQDYTMAVYAEDIAWLCDKLRLVKPVVMGHSMGGIVALELAARYPNLASSVVLLHSFIFLPQTAIALFEASFGGIDTDEDYVSTYRSGLSGTFIPADEGPEKEHILAYYPKASRHVLASAFRNHITEYDATSAAKGCRVPVAHLGDVTTAYVQADLDSFQKLTPQLTRASVLESGHFALSIVPDQVNVMLARFVALHEAK